MRVRFSRGKQREFIKNVLTATNCPSLRELSRRIEINYSTLKNYFVEDRLMSQILFNQLCEISGLKEKVTFISDFWGQSKGGKSL